MRLPAGADRGPSRLRRFARRCAWAAGIAALSIVVVHFYVYWSGARATYLVGDAPTRDVILVLGASVLPDGRPSPMLGERLRAAAELYHAGKGRKILVSGDHGRDDYDEVGAMARALGEQGVPPQDVFLDHAGFRTLDSVSRARSVFGVRSALVVSNPFHVPRAVFLARSRGIDAVGVAAEFGVRYSTRTRVYHEAREACARVLAFCDVYVLGTGPESLGEPVDMAGDGRRTRTRRR